VSFSQTAVPRRYADCLGALWSQETDGDPAPRAHPGRERIVLPTGTVELVFTHGGSFVHPEGRGERRLSRFYVAGQRTRPVTPSPRGTRGVIVVSLQPWALGSLLPDCVGDHDAYLDLRDVQSPSLTAQLEEEFDAATSPAERQDAAYRAAARLVDGAPQAAPEGVRHAVRRLGSTHAPSIHDLADELGVTQRHLSRSFGAWVGLSPKVFARIRRFQHALEVCRRPDSSLAEVAARLGYSDQAHLSHEVRRFSGLSPARLPRHDAGQPSAGQSEPRSPNFERLYL
jgi:AraC-like DNA-binding protein